MEEIPTPDGTALNGEPPPEAEPEVTLLPAAQAWGAIHTKARAEKVVADFLTQESVPHYLPLVLRRRNYGARVRESWLPLFTGYVFFDPTAIERRRVLNTHKVANILVPEDSEPLRLDLENLAQAISVEPAFRRHEWGPPGTPVQVVSGPLAGVHGKLVRQKGLSLLVILVDFVGFGAEVEIDEAHLAPMT